MPWFSRYHADEQTDAGDNRTPPPAAVVGVGKEPEANTVETIETRKSLRFDEVVVKSTLNYCVLEYREEQYELVRHHLQCVMLYVTVSDQLLNWWC